MTRKRLKKLLMGVVLVDRNAAENLSRHRYMSLQGEIVSNLGKWQMLAFAFADLAV